MTTEITTTAQSWRDVKTREDYQQLNDADREAVLISFKDAQQQIEEDAEEGVNFYFKPSFRDLICWGYHVIDPDTYSDFYAVRLLYEIIVKEGVSRSRRRLTNQGEIPNTLEIAKEAGMSFEAAQKATEGATALQDYQQRIQAAQANIPDMLSSLYQQGMKGNVKAAEAYIKHVQKLSTPAPAPASRNYIQINNSVFSSDDLRRLSESQLKQIEQIIKAPDFPAVVIEPQTTQR